MTSEKKHILINGVPGFGFPGEQGMPGIDGSNVLFSKLYIGYTPPEDDPRLSDLPYQLLEFDTNKTNPEGETIYVNKYAKVYGITQDQSVIQPGDVIYISGNNGTTVHAITQDIQIAEIPLATYSFNGIPSFAFRYNHSEPDGKTTIHIDSDNVERFMSVIIYNASTGEIVTQEDLSGGECEYTHVQGNTDNVFCLYRISPIKYKKIFLGSVS